MKYVSCDSCGSDNWKVLYERGKVPHAAGPIVKCLACGLVYVNPRDFERQWFDVPEVLDSYLELTGSRMPVYRFRLREIERYKKSGSLLEVGCYAGAFLNVARQNGWECHGVEPSSVVSEYVKQAYGIDVFPGFLDQARFRAGSFDVVCLFHVLEHLSSPRKELTEIRRILKTNGLLAIEVPDIEHPVHAVMKKPRWLFVPGHFYYFSPQTLSSLLQRVGFEVVSVQPSYKIVSLKRVFDFIRPKVNEKMNRLAGSLLEKMNVGDFSLKIRTSLNFLVIAKPIG